MFFDTTVGLIVVFLAVLGFLRGFVKEVFGIAGIAASVVITMTYHGYFLDVYSMRIHSEALAGILSGITVFVGAIVGAVLVNGVVIRILAPLRHSVLDKTAGSIVGVVKGLALSYVLFFVMETFLYVFAPYPRSEETGRIRLPSWFVETYSYNAFSVASEYMGSAISEPTYDKISAVVHELLDKKRSGRMYVDEE